LKASIKTVSYLLRGFKKYTIILILEELMTSSVLQLPGIRKLKEGIWKKRLNMLDRKRDQKWSCILD
jgi:hypothetical protein